MLDNNNNVLYTTADLNRYAPETHGTTADPCDYCKKTSYLPWAGAQYFVADAVIGPVPINAPVNTIVVDAVTDTGVNSSKSLPYTIVDLRTSGNIRSEQSMDISGTTNAKSYTPHAVYVLEGALGSTIPASENGIPILTNFIQNIKYVDNAKKVSYELLLVYGAVRPDDGNRSVVRRGMRGGARDIDSAFTFSELRNRTFSDITITESPGCCPAKINAKIGDLISDISGIKIYNCTIDKITIELIWQQDGKVLFGTPNAAINAMPMFKYINTFKDISGTATLLNETTNICSDGTPVYQYKIPKIALSKPLTPLDRKLFGYGETKFYTLSTDLSEGYAYAGGSVSFDNALNKKGDYKFSVLATNVVGLGQYNIDNFGELYSN